MPLPMFHIYGMVIGMLLPVWMQGKTILMSSFDLVLYLELIEKHRVTRSFIVPPILLALAKHPIVDKYDMSSLKTLNCGAAPLGEETANAAATRLDCVVKQGWGMTELSPVRHAHTHTDSCHSICICRYITLAGCFAMLW